MASVSKCDFYRKCRGSQVTNIERALLVGLARGIGSMFSEPIFVNIGVAWGATIHCLRAGCQNAILYGVDIDYDTKKLCRPDLLNAHLIRGDSAKVGRLFARDIHMLFIDGCHHYEYVKADIEEWMPKLVGGGIVAFHDYNPSEKNAKRWPDLVGVKQAVDEWNPGWPFVKADSVIAFRRTE